MTRFKDSSDVEGALEKRRHLWMRGMVSLVEVVGVAVAVATVLAVEEGIYFYRFSLQYFFFRAK